MLSTDALLSILDVVATKENVFLGGDNIFMGSPNVFGGQLVAQALNAAFKTVTSEKLCNSLHCYFLLPGNLKVPINYTVEILRDGNSFATRQVRAYQNDVLISVMIVSFQSEEMGFSHQIKMPQVPDPEALTEKLIIPNIKDEKALAIVTKFLATEKPIEMRICPSSENKENSFDNIRQVWFRFKDVGAFKNEQSVQQMLAYASDYNILATALLVHSPKANFTNTQVASLDHSIWFYHPCQYDDWLLFDIQSPITLKARGYATGHIFNRNGTLVAIVSQEGLLRPNPQLLNN